MVPGGQRDAFVSLSWCFPCPDSQEKLPRHSWVLGCPSSEATAVSLPEGSWNWEQLAPRGAKCPMGVSPGGSGLTPTSPSEAKKCSGCEKPRPGAVKGPWILSLDPLERLCWGNGEFCGMGGNGKHQQEHGKAQQGADGWG